jgi:hypothetical protein
MSVLPNITDRGPFTWTKFFWPRIASSKKQAELLLASQKDAAPCVQIVENMMMMMMMMYVCMYVCACIVCVCEFERVERVFQSIAVSDCANFPIRGSIIVDTNPCDGNLRTISQKPH